MTIKIDLPDVVFREAESAASALGMTPNQFCAEAIEEHLRRYVPDSETVNFEPPWMTGFGALSGLASENKLVLEMIEAEFEGSPAGDGNGH